MAGNNTHLTRNVALEIDTTVVQAPGLKVTEEEQTLANAGLLEYTFQVDLKCKNNSTELSLFQDFVKKVKFMSSDSAHNQVSAIRKLIATFIFAMLKIWYTLLIARLTSTTAATLVYTELNVQSFRDMPTSPHSVS